MDTFINAKRLVDLGLKPESYVFKQLNDEVLLTSTKPLAESLVHLEEGGAKNTKSVYADFSLQTT